MLNYSHRYKQDLCSLFLFSPTIKVASLSLRKSGHPKLGFQITISGCSNSVLIKKCSQQALCVLFKQLKIRQLKIKEKIRQLHLLISVLKSCIYIPIYTYMLICKLILGKVRPDTMKIEVVRKGNRKIEWEFIQG